MEKQNLYHDFTIYPGSFISKLPNTFKPLALWIRNKRDFRKNRYKYCFDGVASRHNYPFLHTEKFRHAQQIIEQKIGFDYRIYGRQHQAIWCAEMAIRRFPKSSFVEFGTARGYMMLTVLSALDFSDYDLSNLEVYCFDSFKPYSLDSEGVQSSSNPVNYYYAASISETKSNFSDFPQVTLVEGLLPQSLSQIKTELVSFLHIDLNNAEVEIESLELIWPEIPVGGTILFDDYAFRRYENTTLKVDDFAKRFNQLILGTAFGQGIMVKT